MLKAAATKIDITPPLGVDLQGYASRYKGAESISDPLFARCVVVEDGVGARWALISADVLSFENEDAGRIREIARAALAVPEAHVSVATTHTHSGPALLRLRNFGERDPAYLEYVVNAVGRCVKDALGRLQPVVAVSQRGRAGFAVNRRKPLPDGQIALAPYPEGPADHEVTVTAFFPAGEADRGKAGLPAPVAVVTNYACHPVTLAANYEISADFPGVYARAVESVFPGAVALFLNGASGDINPPAMDGPATTERCGLELAGEVVKLVALAAHAARGRGGDDARLLWQERSVELLLGELPPREELLQRAEECKSRIEALAGRGDGSVNHWLAIKSWAEACLAELDGEPLDRSFEVRLQVAALGDTAWVFLPGELFVEFGLRIKAASPFAFTHVAGYSNGWVGYIPTEDAFKKGGYEPNAYRYWQNRPVSPRAGEVVTAGAIDLLSRCSAELAAAGA